MSPAFGLDWKWSVHASAAGWPVVHVTLNREDSDGTVVVWSGAHAATDKKHTLDALVNQTIKKYVQTMTHETPVGATRVSSLGFLG